MAEYYSNVLLTEVVRASQNSSVWADKSSDNKNEKKK